MSEPFAFDLSAKRTRYTREEMLQELARFGESVGRRPFTMTEYEGWPLKSVSVSTVLSRFGSWRKALELAGFPGAPARCYSAEEMMEKLEAAWRKMGRPPGHDHLQKQAGITTAPYKRRWGSLWAACERLAAFHAGKMTREEMLREVPAHERRPRTKRKGVPLDVRWRILKRDGHRCQACGVSPAVDPMVVMQVDHIVPVSKGGGNEEGNLRTLCRECNAGRSDRGD